jgi:solute carrier family 25 (mitochondrial dicarboxylate transporter), member 10
MAAWPVTWSLFSCAVSRKSHLAFLRIPPLKFTMDSFVAPRPPLALSSSSSLSSSARPPLYSYAFGGMSAVGAVFFTHPFDLLKVHLQTSKKENLGLVRTLRRVLQQQGVSGLYQGISGGAMREGTYSTMRFAVYHFLKDDAVRKNHGEPISTTHNVLLGMVGGALGGAFGNPADIVNIRMQADSRVPPEQRRNYKHAIDGLLRVRREEGSAALLRGVRPNIIRAMLLTTGQIAAYDLAKASLLSNRVVPMADNVQTHILASMVAGLVATTACAPADVVKTRLMNMKHNEYKSATDCFLKVVEHEGVRGLYKGWLPAYMRLGPQTLLTFVFLEQLRKRLL